MHFRPLVCSDINLSPDSSGVGVEISRNSFASIGPVRNGWLRQSRVMWVQVRVPAEPLEAHDFHY